MSVALHEGRALPAVVAWETDRPALAVNVTLLGREPEGELERRVAERSGERLSQTGRCARFAELDNEPGDHAARQSPLQEHEQHRDWHGGHRGEVNVRGQGAQRIAEQVEDDHAAERRERRAASQQHRRDRTPLRRARPQPATGRAGRSTARTGTRGADRSTQ
jgi:hypothetical protein